MDLEFKTYILKKFLYIARYRALAVLLLLLLALAPAMAQNVVYQGQTSTLAVVQQPGETYDWELYNDGTVNFATVPGNCPATSATFVGGSIGASVNVQWLKPGFYFFKVNARNITGCSNNIKIGIMEVKEALPTAVLEVNPGDICEGAWAELEVTFTGTESWSFKLEMKDSAGNSTVKQYSGIQGTNNPYKIPINPLATTTYTVIEVVDKYGTQKNPSNSVKLTVHPLPQKTPIYLKKP